MLRNRFPCGDCTPVLGVSTSCIELVPRVRNQYVVGTVGVTSRAYYTSNEHRYNLYWTRILLELSAIVY